MANDDKLNEVPANACLGGWRWFIVYALLAMMINWPLIGSLTTHISYGHENEISVPLLNLWTVWWNADRAAHGFRDYWDAPIFFPVKKTFLFSESQPTSLIVAPIFWLTGNRGLTYNLYQLLILTLNGFSAHRLVRRLGHSRWLAFCGGVMSQILPFSMWQSGAIQLTTLFGITWTVHAVLDLFGTALPPSAGDDADDESLRENELAEQTAGRNRFHLPVGVRLGFVYGICYWLCNYWGLFLTLLLVPSSLWLWNRRLFSTRFWWELLWAMLISLIMIGPIAFMQRSLSRDHDWSGARSSEMVRDLSAHWRDHTDVPFRNLASWLEAPEQSRANVWTLGGGGLKLVFAPVGLIAALMTRRRRRWGVFVATLGLIAFGLSLGPTVRFDSRLPVLGSVCPYEQMQRFIPGLALIRSPFRFALFVQLATVWLSIEALELVSPARWIRSSEELESPARWISRCFHSLFEQPYHNWTSVLSALPLIVLSTIVTLEAAPTTTRLYEMPARHGIPVWVQWLRDNARQDQPIACLPFPIGSAVSDYEETAVWMYWSTFHRCPLVNGYSGFFPVSYWELKEGLDQYQRPADLKPDAVYQPKFADYAWDNLGLKRLNESSVRYVVVKRSFATTDDIRAHPATKFRWALVVSDEAAAIDVYKLPLADE